jgi:hypothetical protein
MPKALASVQFSTIWLNIVCSTGWKPTGRVWALQKLNYR